MHAAGMDRGVVHLTSGLPYPVRLAGYGLRAPKIPVPGSDLAGVVEAVGKNVTRFQPGDEVFGIGKGTFAELARAPEDKLAQKPADVTFAQAAVIGVSGLTALQALRDHGKVQPGERVLIIGASGGVGSYAVQLAKAFGSHVTGVCSTTKVDLVRDLGADHVVDYTREDFTRSGRRYDVILDNVEARPLSAVRRALAPRGTLVLNSGRGGRWIGPLGRWAKAGVRSLFTHQTLRPNLQRETQQDLFVLQELIEDGAVTPVIDRTYPLSDAAQAFAYVGAGHARGKVVVTT